MKTGLSFEHVSKFYDMENFTAVPLSGLQLGITLYQTSCIKNLKYSIEFDFSKRNYKLINKNISNLFSKHSSTFLEVPVKIHYTLALSPVFIYVEAGASLNYWNNYSINRRFPDIYNSMNSIDNDEAISIKNNIYNIELNRDGYNRLQVGVITGGGIGRRIGEKIHVLCGIEYQKSINNYINNDISKRNGESIRINFIVVCKIF